MRPQVQGPAQIDNEGLSNQEWMWMVVMVLAGEREWSGVEGRRKSSREKVGISDWFMDS